MKIVPCVYASQSGYVNNMQIIPECLVDQIIAFEEGKLDQDKVLALFQLLIDSNLAFQMKGSYEVFAKQLIEGGLCNAA